MKLKVNIEITMPDDFLSSRDGVTNLHDTLERLQAITDERGGTMAHKVFNRRASKRHELADPNEVTTGE